MQTECQCPQKKSETSEKVPGTTRKNCKKTVVFFSLFPLSFNDEARKPTYFRIKASEESQARHNTIIDACQGSGYSNPFEEEEDNS